MVRPVYVISLALAVLGLACFGKVDGSPPGAADPPTSSGGGAAGDRARSSCAHDDECVAAFVGDPCSCDCAAQDAISKVDLERRLVETPRRKCPTTCKPCKPVDVECRAGADRGTCEVVR